MTRAVHRPFSHYDEICHWLYKLVLRDRRRWNQPSGSAYWKAPTAWVLRIDPGNQRARAGLEERGPDLDQLMSP